MWIEDPHEVKAEFFMHFSSRFQHSEGIHPSLDGDMPNHLSSGQSNYLENPFSCDEIKRAVWDCGGDRASGYFPKGCNSSFIALIPKITNAKFVTDFRPISLIGCQYKIIGKLLANRLSTVIGSCVSSEQSAFIKGRNILDGPLVLNEIMAWHLKCKEDLMVFKVDFEKAFDSLRWDFLDLVMVKLGFGLHVLTCKAESVGLFKGVSFGHHSMRISHLIYANDVIFLSEWSSVNAHNLLCMLSCFYLIFGLKINVNKCNVLGVGVSNEEVSNLAKIIGYGAAKFPMKYLGVPVGGNMARCYNWNAIIQKFSSKLSFWKAHLLSYGGCLSLIKSVLRSLLAYYMSIYMMPATVQKKLEAMRNKFFIGDENPIRTLGDYSKPSHEGYRNTIELPVGNNVQDPSPHGRILLLVSLLKSTNTRKKVKMVISDEEEDLISEDPVKQGKIEETENADEEDDYAGVEYDEQQVTLLKASQIDEQSQKTFEAELSVLSAAKILAEASKEKVKTYIRRRRRSTNNSQVSTAVGIFSTAEEILCTGERIAQKLDKEEKEKAAARKKQENIDFENALKLQKQFDQERKEADDMDWNKIIEQVQERQSGSMIRYQALKKKPVTIAQATKNMKIYLKNMAGYKMTNFKGMNYEQSRPIFEEEYRKESFKKLRSVQASSSESTQVHSTIEPKELSEEDLKKMMKIVTVEEFKAEVLQTKYPILAWEIHTEDSKKYWKIIWVNNITKAYQSFEDMFKAFDREDLDTLWRLVKERFTSAQLTEDMEKALWVELKRIYEPDKEDTLWKLQIYMHDPLTWRLYGSCAVHHVSSTRGHEIYMLPEKDYPLTTEAMMLMLSRRLQVEEDSEMARELVMKIFVEANKQGS
ncbi:putative RNA-directed DNA polymerase, eukaryota, reverse transcriptase zinc-binding domain protein [Tanacetum coccineum]